MLVAHGRQASNLFQDGKLFAVIFNTALKLKFHTRLYLALSSSVQKELQVILMRKFVYRKSYRMSYKKQGFIFFVCQNYNAQSPRMKKKILRLCSVIGQDNSKALFEALTGESSIELTAAKHFLSARFLYDLVHQVFRRW